MSRVSAGVLAFAALAAALPQSFGGGGSAPGAPVVDLFTTVHRGALDVSGLSDGAYAIDES